MKYKTTYDTPLGQMVAVADDTHLHLLEFDIPSRLEKQLAQISRPIIDGLSPPLTLLKSELLAYFAGQLQTFKTPIAFQGTPFQLKVWKTLQKIPYGKTWSYLDLAKAIDHPLAFRAVANANGRNKLSIIIPCHRVINSSGALGGYGGGITKKERLLAIEQGKDLNI